MSRVVLLTVFGNDKPGITAALTGELSRHEVRILDMGQSVIHNALSLGMLLHIPETSENNPILKDLLFKGHELGLTVKFDPVSIDEYNEWVAGGGRDRLVVTILGEFITARQISVISNAITNNGLNIASITRLTGRIPLNSTNAGGKSCIEMLLRGKPIDIDRLRCELMEASSECGVDVAFQQDNIYRRNRRLVVFDMDSTLIQCEVIDELAKEAGVESAVSDITKKAMMGELDFNESLRTRLSYLKGLKVSVLEKIALRLPLTDGVERLMINLKKMGYKTAILSGGFTYFGNYLRDKLGFDYVFANQLEIKDGCLTGNVLGEIVNAQKKADYLKEIAQRENIMLEQSIAVGDGANDLPMLHTAGLGIAFHAKPLVRQNAKQSISKFGLDGILYLLGFSDREMI